MTGQWKRISKSIFAGLLTALFLFGLPSSSFAQCASPSGVEGQITRNTDYDQMQYCNGADWIAMTPPPRLVGPGLPDDASLIGWWKLDEIAFSSAADSSGSGKNGSLQGGLDPSVNSGNGILGTALNFDGVDDHVEIANYTGAVDLDAITLSAWIYPESWGENSAADIFRANDFTCHGIEVRLLNDSGQQGLRSYFSSTNDANSVDDTIRLNEWQHIAMTFDDSWPTGSGERHPRLYVNGVEVAYDPAQTAGTGNLNLDTDSCQLAIGSDAGFGAGGGRSFDGFIDDAKLYDRALMAEEIAQCCAGSSGGIVTDGLVGHWKLDETSGTTAIDYASSNNGTMQGGLDAGSDSVPGRVGTGLDFDGVDDSINIGDVELVTQAMSIAFWANIDDLANDAYPIAKYDTSGTNVKAYTVFFEGSNNNIFLNISDGTASGFDNLGHTFASSLPSGWNHYVFTRDGADGHIYMNGIELSLDYDEFDTNNIPDVPTPLIIGDRNNDGREFDGQLDDIRIYDRAITAEEIAQLYRAWDGKITYDADTRVPKFFNGSEWIPMGPVKPTSTGLVGHWKLDEESGTFADSSGFGNDGTQSGGVEYASSGVIGNAAGFDGSDDFVDAGPSVYKAMPLSVSVWFKADNLASVQGENMAVVRQNNSATPFYSWYLFIDDADDKIEFWQNDVSASTGNVVSDLAIVAGTWYHAVGVIEPGGDVKLYVNGTLQTDVDAIPDLLAADGDLVIGSWTAASRRFDGKIDDVRIYNRALSTAEIEDLYEQGVPSLNLTVRDFTTSTELTKVEEVALRGDYAFMASSGDGSIRAIDISDPDNISLVGGTFVSGINQHQGIDIVGDYLYSINLDVPAIFRVIDISDPANMSVVGSTSSSINTGHDIVVVGDYAYTTHIHNGSELCVWDISAPTSPALSSCLNISGISGAEAIAYHSGHLYVTPKGNSAESEKLTSIDISTPSSPVELDQFDDPDFSALIPQQLRDMVIVDNYLFVAEKTNNGFFSIDISDPANMSIAAELPNNGSNWLDSPEGLAYADGIVYAAAAGTTDGVTLIDVSDPTSPRFLDSIQNGTSLNDADSIAVRDGFAYVGLGANGFAIVEVGQFCANPERPEGAILYNTDFNVMQYCDGENWRKIGK